MLFSDLGLGEKLLEAIRNAGYVEPTPIQEQAIPFVLQGRDVLGCAQTGTGKTASFVLPMIEKLASGRARARMPRSLILEPTRELAAQVQENFEKYGAQHKLSTVLIIGGESMQEQTRKLERGVDVLIATPGRLIDQFERGNILMTDIRLLVVDECDRMLDMGFIPDIEKIVARLPRTRQTLLFSATLPPEIRRLADSFLSNPQEISVAPPSSTAERVEQAMITVSAAQKRDALRHLLTSQEVRNAFIFCNRKRDIALLEKFLKRSGFNAGALHGDMVQSARQSTLEQFKQNEITLLVCSDVAARGLDVTGVSHVFNFDVPHHPEDYVHRIGRTGRAGASGVAYMIATPDDAKSVTAIVKLIGKPIPEVSVPDLAPGEEGEEFASSRPSRGRAAERSRERPGERPDRNGGPRGGRTRKKTEKPGTEPPHSGHAHQEDAFQSRPVAVEAATEEAGWHAGEPAHRDRPLQDQSRFRSREDRPREDRPRTHHPHEHRASESRMHGRSENSRYRTEPSRNDSPVSYGRTGAENSPAPPRHVPESRRRYNYEDDQNDAVVGFGDHLPAFLKAVPRLQKLEEQASSEE